ncbi:hypothetical protein [Streptomyces sp. A012304]|uniref:hypothetical protein n=1 Tax=Streptomyces sp. A012304 TaxID=375446 RepID=UPI002230F6D2|nr:hypothetical protein [Streptomyces sp. A012304]GKQ37923.1 hypothetical protein ALMP_44580 [Streptomyces sp. A012304]
MTGFPDKMMIRYLDPAQVGRLLRPEDDPESDRLRSLLAAVYEPSRLEVRSVDSVTVTAKDFQVPVSVPWRAHGSWEKLLPDVAQSRAVLEMPSVTAPHWIDLALDTVVTARVALTEGALESIDSEDVSALPEDEFVARFDFLDLAELMRRAKVADYRDLQDQFPRLYRLHYAQAPPFDPNAPARSYRLRISVLFFAELDLAASLRRLAQCRGAQDDSRPRPDAYDGGALLATSAWLAVFPAAALTVPDPPGSAREVSDLLAAEGCVTAFVDAE